MNFIELLCHSGHCAGAGVLWAVKQTPSGGQEPVGRADVSYIIPRSVEIPLGGGSELSRGCPWTSCFSPCISGLSSVKRAHASTQGAIEGEAKSRLQSLS